MTTLPPPTPSAPGLIVMYHYVRPDGSKIPAGIRPLFASEFEQQLDWLCERYDVVDADEFLRRTYHDCFSQAASLRLRPPCLLTFDDGTRDHATVVTPILARRRLSGVFFVLSGPAQHGEMPLTHAIHWLLSGDDRLVWDTFQRYAHDHLGGVAALGDPAEARRIYHYESPNRARIKYAANMALPAEATEAIVAAAVRAAGRTMPDLAAEWFVSADDLCEMDAAGMAIAAHGRSHRSLQSLGPAGIRDEIRHCSDYIDSLLGHRPTWYACPFGGTGAAPAVVAAMRMAMNEAGILASVSTAKSYVEAGSDPLMLPRLDAIDLPPRRVEASRPDPLSLQGRGRG